MNVLAIGAATYLGVGLVFYLRAQRAAEEKRLASPGASVPNASPVLVVAWPVAFIGGGK